MKTEAGPVASITPARGVALVAASGRALTTLTAPVLGPIRGAARGSRLLDRLVGRPRWTVGRRAVESARGRKLRGTGVSMIVV